MRSWGLILFTLVFLTSSVSNSLANSTNSSHKQVDQSQLIQILKLQNSINAFNFIQKDIGSPLQSSCATTIPPECDVPVHISQWCERQYQALKDEKLRVGPPEQSKGPEILFLAEEHGDEQAYHFYEQLIVSKKYDCLFLEIPSVMQKYFEKKRPAPYDSTTLANPAKRPLEGNIKSINFKSWTYIDHLKSLIKLAKENNVGIHAVDSSKKSDFEGGHLKALKKRNKAMAQNIFKSFEKGSCHKGLSIKGAQHLFASSKEELVRPVDELLKTMADKKLKVAKAMLYSPTSISFQEAMGPCSWTNDLPEDRELYLSKEFFNKQRVFPEKIEQIMNESGLASTNEADFAIFLPLTLDSGFMTKMLNAQKKRPKRYNHKKEFIHTVLDVPLQLRTNAATLGLNFGPESIAFQCSDYCSNLNERSEYLVREVRTLPPRTKCSPINPNNAAGHSYIPKYMSNFEIVTDCYCSKK